MKKLTSKCGRCISKHLFTCAIILLLIVRSCKIQYQSDINHILGDWPDRDRS